MASEAEDEPIFTQPRLLLMPKPHAHLQSPERSGTLIPPLQTSEDEPIFTPPRLLLMPKPHAHLQSPERSGTLIPPLTSEDEPIFTPPRLLLMPKPLAHLQSPERSGTLTPPLQTLASVPFRWEEEPGKPRESTALVPRPINFPQKSLELPPRLLIDTNMTKLPSPTTVLEGPYMGKSSRFQSSSFRIIRGRECYGSFRSCSPEKGQLGTVVPSKRRVKEKGRFPGSWSWVRRGLKGKRESGGGSYVFPSSVDREPADHCVNEEEEMISTSDNVKMTRSGSLSAVSNARSQFWANIYEGLKQVVPWRSKELKKDHGLLI